MMGMRSPDEAENAMRGWMQWWKKEASVERHQTKTKEHPERDRRRCVMEDECYARKRV